MRYIVFLLLAVNTLTAQSIKVNDTDFSKGRLGNVQTIELSDLAKFHGHFCDGLVEGFIALQFGLDQLYPDGVVDRTNTRIVSKSSPCLTDAAIYITGGRMQFNTFYVDNSIDAMYIIQRIDTNETIAIKRKPDIKPAIIDELGDKAIQQELDACELKKLKELEDDYTQFLLKSNPKDLFEAKPLLDWKWDPKYSTYLKTDIINKNIRDCKQ